MSLLPLYFIFLEEGNKEFVFFFFFLHSAFHLLKKVYSWYYVINSIWMTLIVKSHLFFNSHSEKIITN